MGQGIDFALPGPDPRGKFREYYDHRVIHSLPLLLQFLQNHGLSMTFSPKSVCVPILAAVLAASLPTLVAALLALARRFADLEHLLPEGYQSLGTRLDIRHFAATPVGMKVRAHAELTKIAQPLRHRAFPAALIAQCLQFRRPKVLLDRDHVRFSHGFDVSGRH